MTAYFEDLQVLRSAEELADGIWQDVICWDVFARDTFGGQMVRAADSVGANIAEAYGRFHYGEKLQFLYYARGSIFETKYWLNRAASRSVITSPQVQVYASRLTSLARQLNAFSSSIKSLRGSATSRTALREPSPTYETLHDHTDLLLFSIEELSWLENFHEVFPKPTPATCQLPITNPQ